MAKRPTIIAVIALVTLGFLSGCVGGGDEEATSSPTGAPPGQFDEFTGAVTGVVTDDELTPVAAVDLILRPAEATATSASDGSFSFSKVPPGDQTLFAAKLGYSSASLKVSVRAGEQTAGVKVILAPLPVVEARSETVQFNGLITCSIGYAGVLSEECGEGLQTPFGTFGKNSRNNIDWKFNITDFETLENVFLELDWDPSSAAAQQLAFNVAHGFKCTPSCEAVNTYCGAFENYGRPVQKCDITIDMLEDSKAQDPWDITARAWAAPVEETETPNIVVEQQFQMYRTDFWGDPKPEAFSAVKDA